MKLVSNPPSATLEFVRYLVAQRLPVTAHPEEIKEQVFRLMPRTLYTERAQVRGLFYVLRSFRAEARYFNL